MGGAAVKINRKGAKDLPSCSQQGLCYRKKEQMVPSLCQSRLRESLVSFGANVGAFVWKMLYKMHFCW